MKTAVKRSNTHTNFKGKANKAKTKLTHRVEAQFFFSSVKEEPYHWQLGGALHSAAAAGFYSAKSRYDCCLAGLTEDDAPG